MCSYCGCEAEAVLVELMDDHATIAGLAAGAISAREAGDHDEAVALCSRIAALFAVHADKEESGVLGELRSAWGPDAAITEVLDDHVDLRADLAALASGALDGMEATLGRLVRHADREDTDIFPAAMTLLPDQAWARIQRVHDSLGAGQPA
ncbi:MAG TPA: hemerythrin domain-containing protein [Acidimicrobiales bacterium]|nr:hemerythrin domain-containing protein [Acidimicrobiales bacterium]